jgi:hypothetical protein
VREIRWVRLEGSGLFHYAGAALFFAAFTVGLHWKVLLSPSDQVLSGHQVGGFYCWLFWWWSYALKNGLPLFHTDLLMCPGGIPLFLHSPVNEIPAVLLQLFLSPYAAVNLLFMASYCLTGLSAYVLFFRITRDPWASLSGGFAYAFSQYMIVQHLLGQLIEATLYLNPLFALALIQYGEKPSRRQAVWVAISLAGVFLSGPYVGFSFGLMFLLGTFAYDVFWGERRLIQREPFLQLSAAVAAAALLAVVAYWPLLRRTGQWIGGSFFYSLSVASFAALPFWHRAHGMMNLCFARDWFPESAMSYLGFGTIALMGMSVWKGWWKKPPFKFWFWIFVVSVILSLGPWLTISPTLQTRIPLPYLLFYKAPVFSNFRNPGRIMMTASLASSALVAIALSRLTNFRSNFLRLGSALLFIGLICLEFDLPAIGQHFISATPPPPYDVIKNDSGKFAILELPIYYDSNQDMAVIAQYYMLMQVNHRKPMVLGFSSRFLRENLAFTENTPVVYELTHPWTLRLLDERVDLQGRARWMVEEGAHALQRAGIRYVVYHRQIPFYPDIADERLKSWLDRMLRRPVAQDGTVFVYATGR